MIWYALKVAPMREFTAEAMLRRKGYDAFCPVEIKHRRPSRKTKRRVAYAYPMFVRYIFVGSKTGDLPWLQLLAERHISGVVRSDGMPAAIADEKLRHIRELSGKVVAYKLTKNPHKAFQVGEMAKVKVGPFKSFEGAIEEVRGRHAKLLLSLFGRPVWADIDMADLEAA